MNWSEDYETILESIRENAIYLQKVNNRNYTHYKCQLKYFKIPIIIISSMTSVFSVALTRYLAQHYISLITCLLSLLIGIISSIQMYLSLEQNMETCLLCSKDYYLLATDI